MKIIFHAYDLYNVMILKLSFLISIKANNLGTVAFAH